MNVVLVSVAHMNIGQVLGKGQMYKDYGERDNHYHARTITHNHALVLIDGHLQVMRRDKLKKQDKTAEHRLNSLDALQRALRETAIAASQAAIDRKRAAYERLC